MGALFNNMNEDSIRATCIKHIESFESWARRILDEQFKEKFGLEYFEHQVSDGQPLVKSEIKKRVYQRISDDPKRFPRIIDAILLEDVEYFFCRDDLYLSIFKQILEPFFSGQNEIRRIIERIIPVRNKLSHRITISDHEAEQCICYTNDFIQVFKEFYQKLGKSRDYNAPLFLRVKDCLGNDIVRQDLDDYWRLEKYNETKYCVQLRSGDSYRLWVEVDSSFDASSYSVAWNIRKESYSNEAAMKGIGTEVSFSVDNKWVSYSPEIFIALTTKKEWHRHRTFDDCVTISLEKILPPIEETY